MTYQRSPWTDYFNQPSVDQLRGLLPDTATKFFDLARSRVSRMDGISERLKWFGDGWHWSIAFICRHRDEPLAVIVPDPEDLQFAMPLDREFVNGLSSDQVKKTLRDGLELAADPFDTRWAVWTLDTETMVNEVLAFAELKLQYLARIAG